MDSPFEYVECPWGDLIYGTKAQLQQIGIGIGLAFPGDVGGPKRKMTTFDPRGFKCSVTLNHCGEVTVFSVSIPFPGREEQPTGCGDWVTFALGVQRRECSWADEYKGEECALVAAGLVPSGWFPGRPGMRKVCVTILPDGSLPIGVPTSPCTAARTAGAKCIKRSSESEFCVSVKLPNDIAHARSAAVRREHIAWELRMAALLRPPRIDGPLRAAIIRAAADRGAGLQLVWSKPRFVPAFVLPPQGPYGR